MIPVNVELPVSSTQKCVLATDVRHHAHFSKRCMFWKLLSSYPFYTNERLVGKQRRMCKAMHGLHFSFHFEASMLPAYVTPHVESIRAMLGRSWDMESPKFLNALLHAPGLCMLEIRYHILRRG